MKIGFNLLALDRGSADKRICPLFSQLKQWGYDGVEIPLNPNYSMDWVKRNEDRALDAEGSGLHLLRFFAPGFQCH